MWNCKVYLRQCLVSFGGFHTNWWCLVFFFWSWHQNLTLNPIAEITKNHCLLSSCAAHCQESKCNVLTSVNGFPLILSAAVLVILLPGGDAACTEQRECRNEYTSDRRFYRIFWGLTEVPSDIPAEALMVDLYKNAITSIPTGVFNHLTQCTYLRLGSNQIASVPEAAFQGMVSLKELNQIANIEEGTFDHLQSLKILWLYNNNLTSLSPDVFINLLRPLELSLSYISRDTNQWNCPSLCWLKHEEQHGTVTWWGRLLPRCADHGDWASLQCGDVGKVTRRIRSSFHAICVVL